LYFVVEFLTEQHEGILVEDAVSDSEQEFQDPVRKSDGM
jgi:hypothetical protein